MQSAWPTVNIVLTEHHIPYTTAYKLKSLGALGVGLWMNDFGGGCKRKRRWFYEWQGARMVNRFDNIHTQ